MHKSAIKKPTTFNILSNTLVNMITERLKSSNDITDKIPTKVGKYILDYEIKKESSFHNFFVGVYKFKKKKVFIKTWKGVRKDVGYYSIVNECRVARIFDKKLNQGKNSHIIVPKLINVIRGKNKFSVVYEHIQGDNIKKNSITTQERIILKVISRLRDVSQDLSQEEKKVFLVRDKLFYLFSLPAITLTALLCNIKEYNVILISCINAIKFFSGVKNSKLVIAHRDLNPENIIMKRSHEYLLDLERAVLTNDLYDPAYVLVKNKQYFKLKKYFLNSPEKDNVNFFRLYITLHLLADPSNPPSNKKYYIDMLKILSF